MAEPTLTDVLERMTRLEAAMVTVADRMGALEASVRGQAAPASAPQPTAPVAAPAAAAPAPAPVAPRPAGTDPVGAVRHVLAQMFAAACVEDPEAAWQTLEGLTHSADLAPPRAVDHLKAFSWKKLRRTAERYLVDRRADSFRIRRMDPAEPGPKVERLKVFIEPVGPGSPSPVTLRRDPTAGGEWRVSQISL